MIPTLTLRPFAFILIFHLGSFCFNSASFSAIRTRSSAHRSSHGRLLRTSIELTSIILWIQNLSFRASFIILFELDLSGSETDAVLEETAALSLKKRMMENLEEQDFCFDILEVIFQRGGGFFIYNQEKNNNNLIIPDIFL